MTTEIQQTRYDQLVRRSSGIIGPGSKVGEVIPELFPTMDLEDPPAELQILGGTRLAFAGGFVGATASEAGRFQVFNPLNSGHVITVTSFEISAGGDILVRYGIVNVAIAAVATQRFADTRGVFTALPVGSFNQVSSVALAPATGRFLLAGNRRGRIAEPKGLFVLGPGTGLEWGSGTLNIAVNGIAHWRERPALESELNL